VAPTYMAGQTRKQIQLSISRRETLFDQSIEAHN